MDVLWQDLRHALRTLRRDVGFTAVIVLTLAIGIGANTAVFSIVHSTLLTPLPYRDHGRLTMIWTDIGARGVHEAGSAYANIQDWKTQNRVFEDLATFDPTSLTLTDGEWPEQISTARVSANLFPLLGVAPVIGRSFPPEEEQQGASVVVLSHTLWQRRFSASPDAIGRTIEIGGRPFQVLGVMPDRFGFPERNTQLWLPQTVFTDWDATVARRGTDAWRVIGRLQSGVSLEHARSDMSVIASRLERTYPSANAGLGINVVPLYEQLTGHSFRLALWTLFGAVGLVLLIACANAAHLILARGMDRGQEFSVRLALGATTPRLIRQMLTENFLISLAAGIAGLLLAFGGLRLLIAFAPAGLPRLDEIGIDGPVLIYAAGVSLAAGVLFGTAPALSFSRGSPFGLLREGRGLTRRSGYRARNLLIVFQFTLAIILVFGANLLIRSLMEARSVDPGFVPANVLMANLSVESSAQRVTFFEQVLQEVQAVPGVSAAGIVEDLFISGAPNRAITIEGRAADESSFEQIRIDAIAGEFFQAVGVPFREGRGFSGSDGIGAAPIAIINETMARRFWPGESPVGKRFRTGGPGSDAPWIEIVGVVGDMHRQGLESTPIPQVFRPYAQAPSRNMNLLVRSGAPLAGLTSTIRTRIAAIDRSVPLYHVSTVEQALDGYLLERRFQTFLLGLFSVIALILAAVGIYGLMQYSVARRTREMGMRMALGARSETLVMMILRQGLALTLPGLVAGIVCALWLSESISALLFGIEASDLTNILSTSGILLVSALVACYIPARRAARIDPVRALQYP
jgi:predicted permease